MEEKRRIERFKLKLPARVAVISQVPEQGKGIMRLETDNICSGGAFFNTSSPLPEGTQVRLDLLLDLNGLGIPKRRHPHIKVLGDVLRSESSGMAIQFDKSYQIIPSK
jgi:hypothetical protein